MEPVHYCCGEYHDDMEPCDIYDIVVQGIHSRQVSRRMSKYTSTETLGETAWIHVQNQQDD